MEASHSHYPTTLNILLNFESCEVILGMNPIAVMLSMAHRVAEISLLVGTWHAIGYLWGAASNSQLIGVNFNFNPNVI